MSWADDIRCLYCDGRLPLYRKITHGQFCSSAHRKEYWIEQERLAVERLHQTHDSLHAFRISSSSVEEILGRREPEIESPGAVEIPQGENRPWWLPQVNAGELPVIGFIPDSRIPRPRWMIDRIEGVNPSPVPFPTPQRRSAALYTILSVETKIDDPGCALASSVRFGGAPAPAENARAVRAVNFLKFAGEPICRVSREVSPETLEWKPAEEIPAPVCEALLAIGQPAIAEFRTDFPIGIAPVIATLRAQLPLDAVRRHAKLSGAALVAPGLREIPVAQAAIMAPGAWSLRGIDFQKTAPQFVLSTPPLRPRLRFASGRRYSVPSRQPAPMADLAANLPPGLAAVALPDRRTELAPVSSVQAAPGYGEEPKPAGLVPLSCCAFVDHSGSAIRPGPAAWTIPQPLRTEPLIPRSKLEPLDPKPAAEPAFPPPLAAGGSVDIDTRAHVWAHAVDFWNRAPRDLKMLLFALPLLLGLALHPSLPKVRVAAPAAASGLQKNFTNAVNQQWSSVRQSMLDRAAVALDEDFRSGLDDWVSRGDATTDWSFDATGFVRPGPLALYRPSMSLMDYQMQFLGMIDKKALSWVVRAADFDNFYVIKLVVLKPGPLPTIGLTRYAVVHGKADARADSVVRVDAREDMLYRVHLDVHGADFALSVQGQTIDSWSEPRLNHGGIGFFTASGEASRVRWVQVTHQYDMLGRLCAYLSPYNITSANSNWQQ